LANFGLENDPEGLVLRYVENPRPDLKDLIMVQYSGLVERVARKYAGIESQDDLVQVGYIGLLNALGKFDPQAGVRFNTYATYLIAGEIKHYLRDRAQIIRHPAWLQELRHKVNRAVNLLSQDLGRQPTEREIAEHVGVPENSVREVMATQEMLKVGSLDAGAQEDDGDSEGERLDAADFCPEQLGVEDRVLLESALRQLRDLERKVLIHFHFDAMNQTEIAAKLGISCNYVSHILRQSLAKLRKILVAEDQKDRFLRRQEEDLSYEILDTETNAYTESYFRARLEEELHRASAQDSGLGLVVIEFDGLEALRSFYGEQSVRDFLFDAAEVLKSNVRRLDVVCRFGESGFGVLIPFTGIHASLIRERLIRKAEAWMETRFAQNSPVRVRVGHAGFPANGKTLSELLQVAAPGSAQAGAKAKRKAA
jgi:RNA polymerase sigma-B factor